MAFFAPMNNTSENIDQIKSFSLKKKERLSSKKIIDKLFAEGDSILQYPFKMVFLKTELPAKQPVQTGFTASKKLFKRAVDRNRIKRQLREAYRLNKNIIYDEFTTGQLAIFIIFIGKEIMDHKPLEVAMKKGLAKIKNKLTKETT
jgi:ribonuclease P protein component